MKSRDEVLEIIVVVVEPDRERSCCFSEEKQPSREHNE